MGPVPGPPLSPVLHGLVAQRKATPRVCALAIIRGGFLAGAQEQAQPAAEEQLAGPSDRLVRREHLDPTMFSSKYKTLLSLDGGGMRGLVTGVVMMCHEVEEHLLSNTSTGHSRLLILVLAYSCGAGAPGARHQDNHPAQQLAGRRSRSTAPPAA